MFDMEKLFEDAKKGVLPALKLLGDLYLDGSEENDVEADLEKAIAYYTQAAEGGMDDAWLMLGYIYSAGEYMEPNYAKGIVCYERAAELGSTTAMGNLGMTYCQGLGVEKDEKKGFEYFMMAAEGGHPDAMEQIATFYHYGVGVVADEEKAEYWKAQAEARRKELAAEAGNSGGSGSSAVQDAFRANLKFISETELDADFVQDIFDENGELTQYVMGNCAFPTGVIITADPLCYLQDPKHIMPKFQRVAPGSYPVQVAVMEESIAGLRIVGARLKITEAQAVSYEFAKCEKDGKEAELSGIPVECGMACFCDAQAAQSYWEFLAGWYKEHEDGNIYDDYFAELFAQSYAEHPDVQREGGDLLMWSNPLDGSRIAMFASGIGDGFYSDYWGLDASGEICELVMVFMNPELWQEEEYEDNEDEIIELIEEGNELLEDGEIEAAREKYLEALELVPEPKAASYNATWLYATIGDTYDMLEEDYETALGYFRAAYNSVEGDENVFVLYMLGKCYCELGNVAEAKKYFQLAYDYDDRKQIFESDDNKYLKLVERR